MVRLTSRTVLVAVLLFLAGCQAPTPGPDTPSDPGAAASSTDRPDPTAPTDGSGESPAADGPDNSSPVSPVADADRLGWEAGYGANATLSVDASDGLDDDELDAVVARAMARVEVVRGIEFEERVDVSVISRERYREEFGRSAGVGEARRSHANAMYEALFLVGEDEDAVRVTRATFGSVVVGFYSPGRDEIVLVSDGETPTVDETVLAHELVHALQYRHLDAGRLSASTFDGEKAIDGLVEGDARYVDVRYADRCDGNWSCVRPTAAFGGGAGAGGDFRFELYYLAYFPYSDGPEFVRSVHDAGGWERVNALYDDPPESGEQIVEPEAYGTDPPRSVGLPDRSASAWSPIDPDRRAVPDTLGQPAVAAMFAHPTFDGREGLVVPSTDLLNRDDDRLRRVDPFEYDFAYADGWEGDAFRAYRSGDGETAYVWRIVWENRSEAREFAEGYRRLLSYWGGVRANGSETRWHIPEGESGFVDAFSVLVSNDTVTIVNAPSVGALPEVYSNVSFGSRDAEAPVAPAVESRSRPRPG